MLEQEADSLVSHTPREDEIQSMLMLVARLQEQRGGELDDAAVLAVSETTGAPVDLVRMALRTMPKTERNKGLLRRIRNEFLSLDPTIRRYAMAGWLSLVAGTASGLGWVTGDPSSLFGVVALGAGLGAIYNSAVARDAKAAVASGALFGGGLFVVRALTLFGFSLAVQAIPQNQSAWMLLVYMGLGAVGGTLARGVFSRVLRAFGIKDPAVERQALLRQLVELQEQLRSGEQAITFLSVDIVGSTQMKAASDPLAVEFTFNEYHRYVEAVARRHGGRIHSTAGDGVTVAFEHPQQAFVAARNLQSGLIELNTHRNKVGIPIRLRVGVHSGMVVNPTGDIQSVNFAHVIDVAAHLQKVCPEGGVAVSEAASAFVQGGPAAVGEETVSAQDVMARVWRPKVTLAIPTPGR